MALYPSLEEFKLDKMMTAQIKASQSNDPEIQERYQLNNEVARVNASAPTSTALYPTLGNFMGLELNEEFLSQNLPEYSNNTEMNLVSAQPHFHPALVAPLTGQVATYNKIQVTNGIKELVLCKDKDNKVGVRVKNINNGIFVCLVVDKSPASLAGLRFGDQILQINSINVAGYTMDKVHDLFRKSPTNGIHVIIRDRPLERNISLHKDSTKHIGVHFKNGKITSITKDSSAARNGVMINHQILEVQGQNVVGLKDKEISKIIDDSGDCIILTVIPSFLYDHMIKKMAGSLIKNMMDHLTLSL